MVLLNDEIFYLFIFSLIFGYYLVMISEIIDKKLMIVYIILCLLCFSYNINSIIIKLYDFRE